MVAANAIYKLAVIGTVLSQRHVHTLHFRSTLAGSSVGFSEDAWMQDLIDQWQSSCRTAYRAIFGTGDQPCQLYQARKVCGALPLPAGIDEAEAAGSTAGTASKTGDPLPSWLANVTTERTALAGRRFRGRFFLGGLWEQDVNFNDMTTARIAPTQAYADALAAAFVTPLETAVNGKLFVFSVVQSKVPGIQCQNAGADVKTFQVRVPVASMKSRKAGHGD